MQEDILDMVVGGQQTYGMWTTEGSKHHHFNLMYGDFYVNSGPL